METPNDRWWLDTPDEGDDDDPGQEFLDRADLEHERDNDGYYEEDCDG